MLRTLLTIPKGEGFIENLVPLDSLEDMKIQTGMDTAVRKLQDAVKRFEVAIKALEAKIKDWCKAKESEEASAKLEGQLHQLIRNCRSMCMGNLEWRSVNHDFEDDY